MESRLLRLLHCERKQRKLNRGKKTAKNENCIPAWEQRKLGEVAPLQRGFDLPTSDMTAGPYPVVMSNGIGGWHNKCMVKGPGVVTGRSGTIGGLQFIESDYWPHNTSLWVTSFNDNDPRFIFRLYESVHLERFRIGSGVPTLNRNDVHDQVVSVPAEKEEQKKVASFFSQLDNLITLHQREQWMVIYTSVESERITISTS